MQYELLPTVIPTAFMQCHPEAKRGIWVLAWTTGIAAVAKT
jgi:hypothetical protein